MARRMAPVVTTSGTKTTPIVTVTFLADAITVAY
jgi:hypothetical protein